MGHHLVRATTRHPMPTILIVLAITVLALIPASNLSVESGVDAFLSTDDPGVVMAEHVRESLGEQDLATVVVDCSNSDACAALLFPREGALNLFANAVERAVKEHAPIALIPS